MQGFKLVQKMQIIEESESRQRWARYTLRNQSVGNGFNCVSGFPLMRAWDKQLQKNVVIEFIPRRCMLHMFPFPVQATSLLKLLRLQHPHLLGVQDVFYCDRMKCVCIVYDMGIKSVSLSSRLSSMNLNEIQAVFKQIAIALEFLYEKGILVNWFNLEDVFVTVDEVSHEMHVDIRYIKLGCRGDYYHMFVHPESYFPKLVGKNQYTPKDLAAYQLSWQMGILLLEMLRGRQFPPNCTQTEYIHHVDQICNYWNSPDISISVHLPQCMSEILTGLTAIGLEERWHVQKLFGVMWVRYQQKAAVRVGLEREKDFDVSVQQELRACQEDEEEEIESDNVTSRKDAELKEVVEEYIQFYEEAKALQEKHQGRRRQQARRMSLSECYFQVMSNKNIENPLHKYIKSDSSFLNDSINSEVLTEYSIPEEDEYAEEEGEQDNLQNQTSKQSNQQEAPIVNDEEEDDDLSTPNPVILATRSLPPLQLQGLITALSIKWGRCLRHTPSFEL
eukprot:TRINITY_DN10920_c1_g1_i9.p1 TRINITY_DN10920_c1_g1~~TRINITY_DN10920_c1_g1_i9.p1  ORF type:complete len:503 (+),score=49.75 TRINITY_DN10920_c1_g1_i9:316-1824(+)